MHPLQKRTSKLEGANHDTALLVSEIKQFAERRYVGEKKVDNKYSSISCGPHWHSIPNQFILPPFAMNEKKAPGIVCGAIKVHPQVQLQCGERNVNSIACVPHYDMVAISTNSNTVYVHEYGTKGEPLRVFEEHTADVNGLVHIYDDVLASVDDDGMLLTWRASTGIVQDRLELSTDRCFAISKASALVILVGTWEGEIIIVDHTNPKHLVVKERFKPDENADESIHFICGYNDILAAVANANVQIWNYSKGERLSDIGNDEIFTVAVSEGFIAIGGEDCIINVHQIADASRSRVADGYNQVKTIDLKWEDSSIRDIAFVNRDIVMVTTDYNGLFLVSMESGQCISHFRVEKSKNLYRANILSDGRICVGGEDGYCVLLEPPQEVEVIVGEYAKGILEDTRKRTDDDEPPVAVDSERGRVSVVPGEKEEERKMSELWEKMEMMEQRAKEQEGEMGKMKKKIKELETEIADVNIENKEQIIKIIKMEISIIKQEVKAKAQEERNAEMEAQMGKRRRI